MFSFRRDIGLAVSVLMAGVVMSEATVARGDFANRVLLNAPGAIAGFQNQQNFLVSDTVSTLDVTVDYAVWAPGTFPGSYTPFAGFGPMQPTDYVYAYQVYNNGAGNGQSNDAFSQLSINSGGGTVNSLGKDLPGNPGDQVADPSPFAIDTPFAFLTPLGASYQFLITPITPNQFSVVLLLTSPQGPTFAQASVFDHGLSQNGQLPMPVPEPTTVALVLMGVAMVVRRRQSA